jgi:hypothetical protein
VAAGAARAFGPPRRPAAVLTTELSPHRQAANTMGWRVLLNLFVVLCVTSSAGSQLTMGGQADLKMMGGMVRE